jgi:hypothetical protein
MIQYIYFVKCPNCEDEHFDFFDEAKGFALGCLSKKPIITQTEVCRNDFGECTDSSDLGTIWSWEDECKDCQEPVEEPAVFTKDEITKFVDGYDPDTDPEFADDDFFAVNNLEETLVEDYADLYDRIKDMVFDGIIPGPASQYTYVNNWGRMTLVRITDKGVEEVDLKKAYQQAREKDAAEKPLTEGFTFSLNNAKDLEEFMKLCDEVGMKTVGDLDHFVKETAEDEGTILDKLREYRAELGPDFNIKEAYTDPETECIYNDNIECTNNEDCTDCPNNPKNTVYNGKTLKELVEEMEENEDEVECTWCNDLFPKDMCKKEVNLGWLCSRCADGIMSRGETLTFRENNYWDFLDEDAGPRDPFDHHDQDYDEDEAADYMADLIDRAKDAKYDDAIDSLDESRDPFDHHDIDYDDEASADYLSYLSDKAQDEKYDDAIDSLDEGYNPSEYVELYYDDLTITVYGTRRDVDDWDEYEHSGEYTYKVRKDDIATTIFENFITEEDAADVPGGLETLEDNDEWFKFLETHFDALFDKYYEDILKYYEEDAAEEFQYKYEPDDYDDGYDPDAAYDAWRDEQWD